MHEGVPYVPIIPKMQGSQFTLSPSLGVICTIFHLWGSAGCCNLPSWSLLKALVARPFVIYEMREICISPSWSLAKAPCLVHERPVNSSNSHLSRANPVSKTSSNSAHIQFGLILSTQNRVTFCRHPTTKWHIWFRCRHANNFIALLWNEL